MQRLLTRLTQPLDILPLVFFRVAFGLIMLWECWRYFNFNRIVRYFIAPDFYFTYWGFHWVQPLPGDGMIWLWHGLGLLSVLIALGLCYRIATTLFFVAFTYSFLIDQTQYLNHFYLISLISFLLILIPAHRKWSLDALLRKGIRSETAPLWALYSLRAQLTIVYFFGGVAKLNWDWLRGEPMRDWLASRTDFPLIGHLFTQEWMVYSFSYGGLLFDLLIVPLVLWRRTRWFGLALAAGFHLTNARLFNIGIFPWFALCATLLFLPPHWLRFWRYLPAIDQNARWARLISPLQSGFYKLKRRVSNATGSSETIPYTRATDIGAGLKPTRSQEETTLRDDTTRKGLGAEVTLRDAALWLVLGGYFALQVWLPLRDFVHAGNASWSEVGHNLAWHMKLRSKRGDATVYAADPATGFVREVALDTYLNSRQIAQMEDTPQMLLRFAHYLTRLPEYEGHQIYVWSMQSLNGRGAQLLLDPTIDLTQVPYTLANDDAILPLLQPPENTRGRALLLVSRRVDGALQFINIAERPFPLDALQVSIDGQALSLDAAQAPYLATGSCVIAQRVFNSDPLYPICNEASLRIAIDERADLSRQPLTLQVGDADALICDEPLCIVVAD